jgi:hypothetical protein
MNSNLVLNALKDTLASNKERIAVMSQYAGGWEGWLQCELSLQWKPGEVEREAELWADGRACDLWFPSTNFCVELKCFGLNRAFKSSGTPRHISDIASTYKAWSQDILKDAQKLEELPSGWNGLSIVVIPTWLPSKALETIKVQLLPMTYSWQEHEGFYIALRKKGWL